MGPRPGGHGKEVVSGKKASMTTVSMGPRPGGHGKVYGEPWLVEPWVQFQWGHDPEVMVSYSSSADGSDRHLFQWGHDPEVMVSRDSSRGERRAEEFQWGHDPEVMVSGSLTEVAGNTGTRFQWGHDPEVMVRGE